MAKFISDILEAREPHFSQKLAELEKIAGRPGVDVRLVSDIIQRQKNIHKSLGLDSADTQPAEMYYALIEKALSDSKKLSVKIGIAESDAPEVAVKKAVEFIKKTAGNNRLWTLKSSVAKKQLKDNPPKKLMKIFALRSIDSALKREPLSLLFSFAKRTEPKKWHDKYVSQASKLSSIDFDFQPLEISQVSALRQSQLKKVGLNLNQVVYPDFDVAGIVIITPKTRFDGDVLFLVHSILENIRLLKSSSLFFKIHSLESKFPSIIESVRKNSFNVVSRNYKNFGWNAYARNLDPASIQNEGLDFVFDDDFISHNIGDLLENDNVWQHNFLILDGGDVKASCNLSDVILNAVNKRKPAEAHYRFGQMSLHDELFGRYVQLPEIRRFIENGANNNG